MAKINKFEDLEVWQRAREICQFVHTLITTTHMCEITKNKIGAFMYYLRNSGFKGQKFNKNT